VCVCVCVCVCFTHRWWRWGSIVAASKRREGLASWALPQRSRAEVMHKGCGNLIHSEQADIPSLACNAADESRFGNSRLQIHTYSLF
jgi:hypothetical protein